MLQWSLSTLKKCERYIKSLANFWFYVHMVDSQRLWDSRTGAREWSAGNPSTQLVVDDEFILLVNGSFQKVDTWRTRTHALQKTWNLIQFITWNESLRLNHIEKLCWISAFCLPVLTVFSCRLPNSALSPAFPLPLTLCHLSRSEHGPLGMFYANAQLFDWHRAPSTISPNNNEKHFTNRKATFRSDTHIADCVRFGCLPLSSPCKTRWHSNDW